jgi:hypothetical protein
MNRDQIFVDGHMSVTDGSACHSRSFEARTRKNNASTKAKAITGSSKTRRLRANKNIEMIVIAA